LWCLIVWHHRMLSETCDIMIIECRVKHVTSSNVEWNMWHHRMLSETYDVIIHWLGKTCGIWLWHYQMLTGTGVNMTSNLMPERCSLAESRHSSDYNVQLCFSHLIIQCFLEQLTLIFLFLVVEVIKSSRRNLNDGRFWFSVGFYVALFCETSHSFSMRFFLYLFCCVNDLFILIYVWIKNESLFVSIRWK
jgi:hypothetical protein